MNEWWAGSALATPWTKLNPLSHLKALFLDWVFLCQSCGLCVQLTNTTAMNSVQRQRASHAGAFVNRYPGCLSHEGDSEVGEHGWWSRTDRSWRFRSVFRRLCNLFNLYVGFIFYEARQGLPGWLTAEQKDKAVLDARQSAGTGALSVVRPAILT